jgi:hypothetical protein
MGPHKDSMGTARPPCSFISLYRPADHRDRGSNRTLTINTTATQSKTAA